MSGALVQKWLFFTVRVVIAELFVRGVCSGVCGGIQSIVVGGGHFRAVLTAN